jgi:hypothetical protein
MPAIFEALPGLEVPVGAISRSLGEMWVNSAADGRPAPDAEDARATQVNLVLHLGRNTTVADAVRQFEVLVAFSRRYPSRIVVLCPLGREFPEAAMRAKIFGECFLGRSRADKRCVEFVMLSYPLAARPFLEDQVSLCLSTDLPVYYWAHRFADVGRLADYRYLLGRAKRVLLDSAVMPPDVMAYPWPNPAAMRDLAFARLLPVRQVLGQFLAGYPPAEIVAGLRAVRVRHGESLAAEARALLGWLDARCRACGLPPGSAELSLAADSALGREGLAVELLHGSADRFVRWQGDVASGRARFDVQLGAGRVGVESTVALLSPDYALSEAMFF